MMYKIKIYKWKWFRRIFLPLLIGILLAHNVLCLSVEIVNKRPYAFTNKLYVVANVSTVVATNTIVYFLLNNTTVYTTPLIVLGNNSYELVNFTYTLNDNGIYNITVIAHNETDGTNVTDYFIVNASIYEASVNYSNYVYYNGNKYVDTLKYDVSYRCNFIGENKTLYGYFDDGSNSTEVPCLPDIANNLTKGLVLYLGEDEGRGNVTYDYSGHSNNGNLYWMYELQFNGQTSYVGLNSPTNYALWDNGFTTRTVCIRFYTHNATKTQMLYEEGGAFNGMNMYIKDGRVFYCAWAESNGWYGACLNYTISANRIYFVCGVFEGYYDMKLYVNGWLVTNTSVPTTIPAHTDPDCIGKVCSTSEIDLVDVGDGYYFNGTIYEYILWTTNLTATQISDAYKGVFDVAPAAYYKAQEGAIQNGLLKDLSGNGYDVAVYDVVLRSPWVDGKFGKALEFDGVDDYVDLPDSLNPSVGDYNRTVAMWIYIPPQPLGSFTYHNDIIRGGVGWSISTTSLFNDNGGKLVIFAYGYNSGNAWQIVTNTGVLNRWAFVVVTWEFDPSTNTSTVKVYIDGKLDVVAQKTNVSFDPSVFGDLRIGVGGGGYVKGIVDEVRIYNRVLSEEEIKALYLMGIRRHITGSYKFKTEGIKQVHFQLYNETFGYDTFIADLKPPFPILYYDVLPSGKPVVNVYVDENISPIATCSILVNGEPYVVNRTLNSRTVSPDYTWLLDNVEYGYNNITVVCSDLLNHVGANTKFLGISPNLLKTIDWDYPDRYYVGETAEVVGTFTASNVGNAPLKEPQIESIPFTYGENIEIIDKSNNKVIAKYDKWIGPLNIKIPILRPGESITYEIKYTIPTAEVKTTKEYFLIEGGAKYNVYEYEIVSNSPIIMNNLIFRKIGVDCNSISKVEKDGNVIPFRCKDGVLEVNLGTVMPGQSVDLYVYGRGPIEASNSINQIKRNVNNLVNKISNKISNMFGGVFSNLGDYINDILNNISDAINGVISYIRNLLHI